MVEDAVLLSGRDTLQNFNITGCGLFKLKLLSSLPYPPLHQLNDSFVTLACTLKLKLMQYVTASVIVRTLSDNKSCLR